MVELMYILSTKSFRKIPLVMLTALLVITFRLSAQQILSEYDSLPITKPKAFKSVYNVNNPKLHEISIITREPIAVTPIPRKFWENLSEGAFTLLSGFSTTSYNKATWLLNNQLACSNPSYNWNVPLFSQGEFMKNRERINNDDGSVSIGVQKGVYVDWNQPGYGIIMENSDTVGGFSILTNIQQDSAGLYWLSKVNSEGAGITNNLQYFIEGQGYNFTVQGIFRGRSFSMISSGSCYRSVILFEEKPVAVFQNHPDYTALNKKNRLSPYILFAKNVQEVDSSDLIRLSFLTSLVSRCINVDFYPR